MYTWQEVSIMELKNLSVSLECDAVDCDAALEFDLNRESLIEISKNGCVDAVRSYIASRGFDEGWSYIMTFGVWLCAKHSEPFDQFVGDDEDYNDAEIAAVLKGIVELKSVTMEIAEKQARSRGWGCEMEIKMMPGQAPYTEVELKAVQSLVSDAAEAEPIDELEEFAMSNELYQGKPIRMNAANGDIGFVVERNGQYCRVSIDNKVKVVWTKDLLSLGDWMKKYRRLEARTM